MVFSAQSRHSETTTNSTLKLAFCGFLHFPRTPFIAHVDSPPSRFIVISTRDQNYFQSFIFTISICPIIISIVASISTRSTTTANEFIVVALVILYPLFRRMSRVCNPPRISATRNQRRAKDERDGRNTCGPSN